ncbi:MAG: ADP-ribosylglycohydrolase family protein, partial [Mycolicibacter sinensis]
MTTVQRDRACGVLLGTAAGEALGAAKGGEWIGGTAMAIAVAELAAIQVDLRRDVIQDRIVERWDWRAKTVKRIGGQPALLAPTASVALAHLDDETALAAAARVISDLAHHDRDAGDAGVLWCAAIRHAVLTGQLDIRIGLGQLDIGRQQWWSVRFDAAENTPPHEFTAAGGVVVELQAAWSAIVHTPIPVDEAAKEVFRVDHLRPTLEAAAIAGAGP